MPRSFRKDMENPDHFVITLELVPGSDFRGLTVDTVTRIAQDAMTDGRVSAVTITDNPGGNPSLSPDVIGNEIQDQGMDVMVHFTCRDQNRGGIESRALQLARMGMHNILALTGDYSGKGFGGQGKPVFDIDSTSLICFLKMLGKRMKENSHEFDEFFTGCAVSPFKMTEAETFCQYFKLCKKTSAGAHFAITQVGYDARKFHELLRIQDDFGIRLPTLGSVYVLAPGAAKIMSQGRIPGADVPYALYDTVRKEWGDKAYGRGMAIERAAQLAVILKGLGYKGIHVGGVHKSFSTLGKILDRMAEIEEDWQSFLPNFDFPVKNGFYVYQKEPETGLSGEGFSKRSGKASTSERFHYRMMQGLHDIFFNFDSQLEPVFEKVCERIDRFPGGDLLMQLLEGPPKKLLLQCKNCGDCAIQHLGFICPESQCPKHIRNGACGGSRNGKCEVYPDRDCAWVRVYRRLSSEGDIRDLACEFVPPRRWELNQSSSWLNFHRRRDHQSASCAITRFCTTETCELPCEAHKTMAPLDRLKDA